VARPYHWSRAFCASSRSSIDVNEKLIVEVLTPYQGRTRGDEVKQGQALFTVHDR
jgi:hypothetical protein